MLESLRVKNLAIVEDVTVELGDGLSAITGETGAGKSILVGALGLVLGERADRSLVRADEKQCTVEAVFRVDGDSPVNELLGEIGVEPCSDGRLIVRRVVASSGGGKCVVNDGTVTVQALKRVGDLLVDMHGPHDHQSLLSREFQLDILDSFGRLWKVRAAYAAVYDEITRLEQKRRELDCSDRDVVQQIDMLSYQIREIEEAELAEGMEEELERDHSMAANAQQILELTSGAANALTEGETSALELLTSARNSVASLEGVVQDAAMWREEMESICVQIQELSRSLAECAGGADSDPARLRALEDRVGLLHSLKRKYGSSVAEILQFLADAKTRLEELGSREAKLAELDGLLVRLRERLAFAGGKLAAGRRKVARGLAEAITNELRELGFEHGVFDVTLEQVEPGPSGLDEIEFGFAPNPGEPMRPLRAIASSGEISRVMLATKAVLAAHDRIPVLVFDEIDANIGGEMGNAVGAKLEAVARHHQVLCITHLPQVAVHGAAHLVVIKEVSGGRTHTGIAPVSGDARAEEIARMLGGSESSTVVLQHAREMLGRSGE